MQKHWFSWSGIVILVLIIIIGAITIIHTSTEVKAKPPVKDAVQVQKQVYNEDVPINTNDELNGIVYKGYLLKDVRENEWGWSIPAISKALDITYVVDNSQIPDAIVPINFTLQRESTKLTFKGNVIANKDLKIPKGAYLTEPEAANLSYRVYKNGKELSFEKAPYTIKAGGPYVDLDELLQALNISYVKQNKTYYIDEKKPTTIIGKVLINQTIQLDDHKKLPIKLIYDYDNLENYRYRKIDLIVNNHKNRPITIYTAIQPGSYPYYRDAIFSYQTYKGLDLLQLELGLGHDTIIYKVNNDQLTPIFTKEYYQQFLNDNLYLETDKYGHITYVDKKSDYKHPIAIDQTLAPNSIYKLHSQIMDSMKLDVPNNQLKLVIMAGAFHQGKNIFTIYLEFIYNGQSFVPSKAYSIDWKKRDQAKISGKNIKSNLDYARFEYSLK